MSSGSRLQLRHPAVLLVTGTDTGIGKTTVSALLIADLVRRGYVVGAVKPVETGCTPTCNGELVPADGLLLSTVVNAEQTLEEIVPKRYASPVAPIVAAEHEAKRNIEPGELVAAITEQAAKCDLLVVEGAGGLLVPIAKSYTYAELGNDCSAAVLVVVESKLGAINHASLTLEVLKSRGLDVVGYVLNELIERGSVTRQAEGLVDALTTNRALLEKIAQEHKVKELTVVPYIENCQALSVISEFSNNACIKDLADSVLDYFCR